MDWDWDGILAHDDEEDLSERRRKNRVDRFAELPDATREWLEDLRPKDIETINEALRVYVQSKTVGSFGKWAVLTVVGIFITAATLGDSIAKLIVWMRGIR